MGTIAYYVHGRGRGHATRSEVGIRALRDAGHELIVRAGEDALAFLAEADPISSLRPGLGWATLPLLMRRVREDARLLRARGVDLVVSDSDMPSILAASLCGRASIAVGHGLAFSHCQRPTSLPAIPWRREAWTAGPAAWTSDLQVVVNFVDLPVRRPSTRIVGPQLSDALQQALASRPASREERVLCYFRDDNADPVLKALVDVGARPLLFSPHGRAPDGVEVQPLDRRRFAEALVRAKAVVASAGSQLMSECVAMGTPLYALHGVHDREQRLNVAMLHARGLGHGGAFETFDAGALRRWWTDLPSGAPTIQGAPMPAERFDEVLVACAAELLSGDTRRP